MRKYIKKAIVGIIILLICIIIVISTRAKKVGIDRYTWIKNLAEAFSMTEYESRQPYFSDVDNENDYYPYVQSAYEWRIIDNTNIFDGNEVIDGQYVAVTGVKALGKTKIEIFIDKSFDMSDKACVEFALQNNIIEKSELKNGISQERCNEIIDALVDLYFYKMWVADYQKIDYSDGVLELKPSDIIKVNLNENSLQLNKNVKLAVGDKIIYVDKRGSVFGKVDSISSTNEIKLVNTEIDEIIDCAIVSKQVDITMDDILNYYGVDRHSLEASTHLDNSIYVSSQSNDSVKKVDSGGLSYGGISIELSGNNNHLEVKITENDTGLSFSIPTGYPIPKNSYVEGSMSFSDIVIGTQYSFFEGNARYINSQMTYNVSSNMGFSNTSDDYSSNEGVIPLFKVAPTNGFTTLEMSVNLYINMQGIVSLGLSAPGQVAFTWQEGTCPRVNQQCDSSIDFLASCKMGLYIQPEIELKILGVFEVFDATLDVGAEAEGEATVRTDKRVLVCSDVQLYGPVVKFSIKADLLNIEYSKDIISKENAQIRLVDNHCELYRDGSVAFLNRCSLGDVLGNLRPGRYELILKKVPTVSKNGVSLTCDIYNKMDQISEVEYRDLLKGKKLSVFEHDYRFVGNDSNEVLGYNLDNDLCVETYDSMSSTFNWKIDNKFVFLKDQKGEIYLLFEKCDPWYTKDDPNMTETNHSVLPYFIGKIETDYLDWDDEIRTSSIINSFYTKVESGCTIDVNGSTDIQIRNAHYAFNEAVRKQKITGDCIELEKLIDGTIRYRIVGDSERSLFFIWEP